MTLGQAIRQQSLTEFVPTIDPTGSKSAGTVAPKWEVVSDQYACSYKRTNVRKNNILVTMC